MINIGQKMEGEKKWEINFYVYCNAPLQKSYNPEILICHKAVANFVKF